MTITQKIDILWSKAYTDALGAGINPDAYADEKVSHLRATLRAVERKQQHPNGLPRQGCRVSRARGEG